MTNPFATPSGNTAVQDNPFALPGGAGDYPRVTQLLHKLLLLEPIKMEQVSGQYGVQDRWEADTTVFNEDGTTPTHSAMYWSHKAIGSALRGAHGRPVLGTLHVVPVQASKKHFADEDALLANEDMQRWIARGGTGNPPFTVAWVLKDPTPEETAKATAFWNARASKAPF